MWKLCQSRRLTLPSAHINPQGPAILVSTTARGTPILGRVPQVRYNTLVIVLNDYKLLQSLFLKIMLMF